MTYYLSAFFPITINNHVIYNFAEFSGSNSSTIGGITCYACGLGDEDSPAKHLSDCTHIQTCQLGEVRYFLNKHVNPGRFFKKFSYQQLNKML